MLFWGELCIKREGRKEGGEGVKERSCKEDGMTFCKVRESTGRMLAGKMWKERGEGKYTGRNSERGEGKCGKEVKGEEERMVVTKELEGVKRGKEGGRLQKCEASSERVGREGKGGKARERREGKGRERKGRFVTSG